MRLIFICLVILSCSQKLQVKNNYVIPKGLTAHDSAYLYQAQNDLNEIKRLSKLKTKKHDR